MTSEEILALPAGPDLDALVAEKVMGWRKCGEHYFWIDPEKPDEIHGVGYQHGQGDDWDFEHFKPSADIAHAWKALERMPPRDNLGWFLSISRGPDGWWVSYEGGYEGTDTIASGPTPMLAICRAALLLAAKKSALPPVV